MNTVFVYCDTEDGETWAKAWKRDEGTRHEMFEKMGIKCRTFRDSDNHNRCGVLFEIPDMTAFESHLESDETKEAMAEDGLQLQTFRMLTEFTP